MTNEPRAPASPPVPPVIRAWPCPCTTVAVAASVANVATPAVAHHRRSGSRAREQRDDHRAQRRVVEARVRAAHARLELVDHDAAGGAIAERVKDDREPDGAAVADEEGALRVIDTEWLAGLNQREPEQVAAER